MLVTGSGRVVVTLGNITGVGPPMPCMHPHWVEDITRLASRPPVENW
jgi:hypothetical protein